MRSRPSSSVKLSTDDLPQNSSISDDQEQPYPQQLSQSSPRSRFLIQRFVPL
jgi:hypothetical protein